MKCPSDGAEFNTVEALGEHLWRYHGSLKSNIEIAELIFELLGEGEKK